VTDLELMQSIKYKWGTVIATAADNSSVPAAFLAALIANESGGDENAKRLEKGVLAALWEVLLGRKTAYGSISRVSLVGYIAGVSLPTTNVPANLPADAFQRADALASSWGLTQIMGYHILEGGSTKTIDGLRDPALHMAMCTRMLAQFATHFQLDITKDFSAMLHCWNGGHPTAETADPNYVPNAMRRMDLWTTLT
jgi:hypothetical protein